MNLRLLHILLPLALGSVLSAPFAVAAEPTKNGGAKIKDSAYYEFRGRVSDRNTLERTFIMEWAKGSQVIIVTPETKVFREGRGAKLADVKSGDAVRGVGQAKGGKIIALAVAFGSEGVELPPGIKIPDSITLPPPTRE